MVAVATTLPCGYSGIEAEISVVHDTGNAFTSTDLGRWEAWLESLADKDLSGPGNTVLIAASDIIRFFVDGGTLADKQATTDAAIVKITNGNAGIGLQVEIEVTDYETYTFDSTNWTNLNKGVSQQYFQLTATGDHRPIRRSTGSREPVSSTSCFDECVNRLIAHGGIVRIKRR
jgi:hypothetical protein